MSKEKYAFRKLGMSQVWQADRVVPVTILKAEPNQSGGIFESLKPGVLLFVSGLSKGRGFQGVVKRHGFHGGPKSHGQKDRLRAPGSIGATATQRVIKGKKMAGHFGQETITVKGLKIIEVKEADKKMLVQGAVPGARGAKIKIWRQNS